MGDAVLVNFHTHTLFSDGEQTPEALARTADFAKRLGRGTLLSAAGGVNAENAAAYAAAGAVILVTSWPYWGRPRDVKMTFAREA